MGIGADILVKKLLSDRTILSFSLVLDTVGDYTAFVNDELIINKSIQFIYSAYFLGGISLLARLNNNR